MAKAKRRGRGGARRTAPAGSKGKARARGKTRKTGRLRPKARARASAARSRKAKPGKATAKKALGKKAKAARTTGSAAGRTAAKTRAKTRATKAKAQPKPSATAKRTASAKPTGTTARPTATAKPASTATARKAPKGRRRAQARLSIAERFASVPSSLSLEPHRSAASSGRLELADERRKHAGMSRDITGGDVDVDVESAYFTGDEAPGGDNPAPGQDVVDDIGRALGIEYQDAEELRGSDKVTARDRHRWELDPASSEDYPTRK